MRIHGESKLIPLPIPSRRRPPAPRPPRGAQDATNSVDWSSPDLAKWPKFKDLQANEVIMSPGDFLYLPTHWFHYIISLGLNYQVRHIILKRAAGGLPSSFFGRV